jgi:hypothetical protein
VPLLPRLLRSVGDGNNSSFTVDHVERVTVVVIFSAVVVELVLAAVIGHQSPVVLPLLDGACSNGVDQIVVF